MKINLRTRPLITDKDKRFKEEFWQKINIIDKNDALSKIKSIDWDYHAITIQNIILDDDEITTCKLLEPALNLHNSSNDIELYFGIFDTDNFDYSLITINNGKFNSLDGSGLSLQQVLSVIDYFFEEKYDSIKNILNKPDHGTSRYREILVERETQKSEQNRTNNFIKLGLYVVICLLLYLWMKYF